MSTIEDKKSAEPIEVPQSQYIVGQHRVYVLTTFSLSFCDLANANARRANGADAIKLSDASRYAAEPTSLVPKNGHGRAKVSEVRRWIPASNLSALKNRTLRRSNSKPRVWLPSKREASSHILHPHIERLLAGQNAELLRLYKLSDQARRLVQHANLAAAATPVDKRQSHSLVLALAPSKVRRLQLFAETPLAPGTKPHPSGNFATHTVDIADIELYTFKTGIAVAVAEIEVVPVGRERAMTAEELAFVSADLRNGGALAWQVAKGPDTGSYATEAFKLSDIFRSLVPQQWGRLVDRNITHTVAVVDCTEPGPVNEADVRRMASFLAKPSSDGLDLTRNNEVALVQERSGFIHALALEGGASVYARPTSSASMSKTEGVSGQLIGEVAKTYVPLAALNLHELNASLSLSARALRWPGVRSHEAHGMYSVLSGIREHALGLRLAYRFEEVSPSSSYREFHRRQREVFGLARIEEELRRDISDIGEHLRERQALHLETRLRAAQSLIGGSTAALLGYHMAEKFIPKAAHVTNFAYLKMLAEYHDETNLFFALLFFTVGAYVAGKLGQKNAKHEAQEEQAIYSSHNNHETGS
jgi:hypothetical protein